MRGLFGTLARGVETKTADVSGLTWERLWGEAARAKSGVSVNVDSALRVSTVLACAKVIANGVAQIPLKVYREGRDGQKLPAKDHPAYRLLWRRPNDWMTSFDLRHLMTMRAVLLGDAYCYVGRGGRHDRLVEILPLTGSVRVEQGEDWAVVYHVTGRDGVERSFAAETILHLRGPSWNGFSGLHAIQLAREAIGLAIATEESHARLHANGAKPGGLISFTNQLTPEAKAALKAAASAEIAGLSNAYRTMVLDNGATWTPFAMTGVDAEHLNTRRFQIEEICRDLGVFPQMIGHSDKTSTFASAEAFFQAHVTHTLEPWIERWQQTLARDLFPDEDDITAEFSVQGLLRGDHKTRSEFYRAALGTTQQPGWMSKNEIRALENLNPVEGGDEMTPLITESAASQGDGNGRAV